MELERTAIKILEKRYLKKDKKGQVIESPEAMFKRVARAVAGAERLYGDQKKAEEMEEKFFHMMSSLEFLPNSPTLMNAGRRMGQLSACFVLPVEDSIKGIFTTLKDAAVIHQSGGGTGFSFSRLRPKGDIVMSTRGFSSGPLSFMRIFNEATTAVSQGGTRRGANMGILRVDHPDIVDFIQAKQTEESLVNFNISVGITDAFMKALEKDETYCLINPRTGEESKRERARAIFDLITHNAWENGEPGVVFLDVINRDNPTPGLGTIESTNPCGEQPLLPYESCNLGSINLLKMMRRSVSGQWNLDYDKLASTVELTVRFLDNVIDVNRYPLRRIQGITKGNRKIGLGVMGFADLLVRMGMRYNSPEALKFAEELMKFIKEQAVKTSLALAKQRGPFPNISQSIYARDSLRLRNSTLTTIAPTGTISLIANCSSGIEPIFSVAHLRRTIDEEVILVDPVFKEIAQEKGFYREELIKQIIPKGTLEPIDAIPKDIKKLFVVSQELSYVDHIRMQAAFQKYTDNAVSKTINFSYDTTPKDVGRAFKLAYELGCKGVTLYRIGSRKRQVLYCG